MDSTSGQIHYVDHLTVSELAELLDVHESYVHRHLATTFHDRWPFTRWVRSKVLFSPADVTTILEKTARRRDGQTLRAVGDNATQEATDDAQSA